MRLTTSKGNPRILRPITTVANALVSGLGMSGTIKLGEIG